MAKGQALCQGKNLLGKKTSEKVPWSLLLFYVNSALLCGQGQELITLDNELAWVGGWVGG